ncbi:MAG TPA: carbamoyltransferase N-terminal domain-containing protein [Anaerolineales bacterium]|nr:carbamoyltransferase N-terminal domain-containing protein [Anaerolineales bacterium]
MNIIGLSAFYHESACCLLQDGRLCAAASEERFSRVKHDPRLPAAAYRYCLQAGGIHPGELDCIAYYEDPVKKLARQLWSDAHLRRPDAVDRLDPRRPERLIRERLGFDGPVLTCDHHASHAASAYYFSGFDEAAVLTVDGVGEWDTTTYARAAGGEIEIFERVEFPDSLGLLYAAVTAYLGFRINDGEYKVMGLAALGRPRYRAAVSRLVRAESGGGFQLDQALFNRFRGDRMYNDRWESLLGFPPRDPAGPVDERHADLAASLQAVLEEILLEKVRYLHGRTGGENLCLAGGVALNAVANGRIRREGPFRNVFIQPAAGDAGACLGAAALAHRRLAGDGPPLAELTSVYLGSEPAPGEISWLLERTGVRAADFTGRFAGLAEQTARLLAEGRLAGWFQGRMEFGPRALGNRSILADPRNPNARYRLNRLVKGREDFRPFAPSVLEKHAAEHFDLRGPSRFMLETCRVISALGLPAITHIDGSARPQTVAPDENERFATLLEAFHVRTGCPVLLNTSFNVAGQPIVRTPEEALLTMAAAGLDALVLGDYLVERSGLPVGLAESFIEVPLTADPDPGSVGNLYTFV